MLERQTLFIVGRLDLQKRIVREHGAPTLFALSRASDCWSSDAGSLLAWMGHSVPRAIDEEFAEVDRVIIEASIQRSLPYPDFYATAAQTTRFLYAAVRLLRPRVILETGVGNGRSSATLLSALDANGDGELHSIDISHDVGALVGSHPRWRLHILPEVYSLEETVSAIGPLDLFFHDGEHSRTTQLTEYGVAWRYLRPGGVLASDDIDWSYAFMDFCASVGRKPGCLLDGTKVAGVLSR